MTTYDDAELDALALELLKDILDGQLNYPEVINDREKISIALKQIRDAYEKPINFKGVLCHEDFRNSLNYQRELAEMQFEEIQKLQKEIAAIRDARCVGPSRMDMVEAKTEHQRLHRELDRYSVHESWYACYDWFSDQLRLEPAPEPKKMSIKDEVTSMVKRNNCGDCGNPWWVEYPNSWVCSMCRKTHAKSSSELARLDDVTDKPQKHYKSFQDVTAPISDEELWEIACTRTGFGTVEPGDSTEMLRYREAKGIEWGFRAAEKHHGVKGDE